MPQRPLIYDVGINNGDDTAYYLKKGFDVVGIDAHPGLCKFCEQRFQDEIAAGRLTLLHVGVGDKEETREFYQNPGEDPISTFFPDYWKQFDKEQIWEPVKVDIRKLSTLIREHGEPYFVKIDVEYFDHIALLDMYRENILPPYVSAEAQLIDVYCALVSMGYEQFKLVRGKTIPVEFANARLTTRDGQPFTHEFSRISSGPFGDDLPGEWLNKDAVLKQLLEHGLGWIDLHARR